MNYFGYQTNMSGSIWGLFKDLGEITPEQRERAYAGSEYSHTLEIVSAALSGVLSTDPESLSNFNLRTYEGKCAENDDIVRKNRAKKVLNIVEFTTSSDDSLKPGYGDVSDRDLASDDDFIDVLENSIAFEENIRSLLNIRSKYISERGVDVVSVLYGALKGIPDAISEMRSLVKDNALRDLYTQLCEGSIDGALLRRLEVAV